MLAAGLIDLALGILFVVAFLRTAPSPVSPPLKDLRPSSLPAPSDPMSATPVARSMARDLIALATSLAACFAVAGLGGYWTEPGPRPLV